MPELIPAVAVVVVPALEPTTTALAAAAAVAPVFPGFSYGYADGATINRCAIQFSDSFLGGFII
jgi:hypothetical protein